MATAQTSMPTLIPELSRQGVKTLFCGSMSVSVRVYLCMFVYLCFRHVYIRNECSYTYTVFFLLLEFCHLQRQRLSARFTAPVLFGCMPRNI